MNIVNNILSYTWNATISYYSCAGPLIQGFFFSIVNNAVLQDPW